MCSRGQAKGGQELDGQAVAVRWGPPSSGHREEHSGSTAVR